MPTHRRLGQAEVIRYRLLRQAVRSGVRTVVRMGVRQHVQDQEHGPPDADLLTQPLVGHPAAEQVGPVQVMQDLLVIIR